MMALVFFVVVLVAWLPILCAAVGEVGNFFNPPATTNQDLEFNAVFRLDEIVTIKWTTTLSNYSIVFYQNVPGVAANRGEAAIYSTTDGSGVQQFRWRVQTYDFSLDDTPVYFFWLSEGEFEDIGDPSTLDSTGFTSAYFNITQEDTSSSSSSSSTSSSSRLSSSSTRSATLSSTASTSATNAAAASQTNANSNANSNSTADASPSSSGIGTGGIVGIVAAIVGALAVAGLAAFWWYRKRQRAQAATAANTSALAAMSEKKDVDEKDSPSIAYSPLKHEMDGAHRAELPPDDLPVELAPGQQLWEMEATRRPPAELP